MELNCEGYNFRYPRSYGFYVLQFSKLNKDEQELSIGPKSFPVEPGKGQLFSLGLLQVEVPANDPIITAFAWLILVGIDEGSCELFVACNKTGYIEMEEGKFHNAFADSTVLINLFVPRRRGMVCNLQ